MCYLDNGKRSRFDFWSEQIVLPKILKEFWLGCLESIYGNGDINSRTFFYFKVNWMTAFDIYYGNFQRNNFVHFEN